MQGLGLLGPKLRKRLSAFLGVSTPEVEQHYSNQSQQGTAP